MFKPSEKRVLIKPDQNEKITSTGIILPDTLKEERPITGVVVAPTDKFSGRVLFSKYGADDVEIEGEPYVVVHEDSILGTFI